MRRWSCEAAARSGRRSRANPPAPPSGGLRSGRARLPSCPPRSPPPRWRGGRRGAPRRSPPARPAASRAPSDRRRSAGSRAKACLAIRPRAEPRPPAAAHGRHSPGRISARGGTRLHRTRSSRPAPAGPRKGGPTARGAGGPARWHHSETNAAAPGPSGDPRRASRSPAHRRTPCTGPTASIPAKRSRAVRDGRAGRGTSHPLQSRPRRGAARSNPPPRRPSRAWPCLRGGGPPTPPLRSDAPPERRARDRPMPSLGTAATACPRREGRRRRPARAAPRRSTPAPLPRRCGRRAPGVRAALQGQPRRPSNGGRDDGRAGRRHPSCPKLFGADRLGASVRQDSKGSLPKFPC